MENKGVIARKGWLHSLAGLLLHAAGVLSVAAVAIALLLAGLVWITVQETPDVDHLRTVRAVQPSVVRPPMAAN